MFISGPHIHIIPISEIEKVPLPQFAGRKRLDKSCQTASGMAPIFPNCFRTSILPFLDPFDFTFQVEIQQASAGINNIPAFAPPPAVSSPFNLKTHAIDLITTKTIYNHGPSGRRNEF